MIIFQLRVEKKKKKSIRTSPPGEQTKVQSNRFRMFIRKHRWTMIPNMRVVPPDVVEALEHDLCEESGGACFGSANGFECAWVPQGRH